MIQSIVTRMANYSATLKNYCVTVITAIAGFAVSVQRPLVMVLALMPVLIFSMLDAQYLRLERRFRAVYDQVRAEGWETQPNFEINIQTAPRESFWRALFSWSIGVFYLPLGFAVVVVLLIAVMVYGRFV